MKSNVVLAVAAMVTIDASFMPSVLWAADETATNSSYSELRAWLTPVGAVLVLLLGGWTERRKARILLSPRVSGTQTVLRRARIENNEHRVVLLSPEAESRRSTRCKR